MLCCCYHVKKVVSRNAHTKSQLISPLKNTRPISLLPDPLRHCVNHTDSASVFHGYVTYTSVPDTKGED